MLNKKIIVLSFLLLLQNNINAGNFSSSDIKAFKGLTNKINLFNTKKKLALGAEIVMKALNHINNFEISLALGPSEGPLKVDREIINMIAKKIDNLRMKSQEVDDALNYVISDFEKKVEDDNVRLHLDPLVWKNIEKDRMLLKDLKKDQSKNAAQIKMVENRIEENTKKRFKELRREYKTSNFRNQLIDVEFEELDKYYQKVLNAIPKSSRNQLPTTITLDALRTFAK